MVRAAAEAGIGVNLNSTLTGLTARRAGAFREAGLKETSVSFYGDRGFHDALVRRQGCYDASRSACLALRALGVDVDVHGPLWAENLRHAGRLRVLAEQIGASSLTFFKIVTAPHTAGAARQSKFAEPAEGVFTGLLDELRLHASIPIRSVAFRRSADESCEQACSIIRIDAALRLTPCLLSRPSYGEPAVIRRGSLGEALRLFRDGLRNGDWLPRCRQESNTRTHFQHLE